MTISTPNIRPAFAGKTTQAKPLSQPALRFGHDPSHNHDHGDEFQSSEATETAPEKPGYFGRLASFLNPLEFKQWGVINNPIVALGVGAAIGIALGGIPLIATLPLALIVWPMFTGGTDEVAENDEEAQAEGETKTSEGPQAEDKTDAEIETNFEMLLTPLEEMKDQALFVKTLQDSENQEKLKVALENKNPDKLSPELKQVFQLLNLAKASDPSDFSLQESIDDLIQLGQEEKFNEFIQEFNQTIQKAQEELENVNNENPETQTEVTKTQAPQETTQAEPPKETTKPAQPEEPKTTTIAKALPPALLKPAKNQNALVGSLKNKKNRQQLTKALEANNPKGLSAPLTVGFKIIQAMAFNEFDPMTPEQGIQKLQDLAESKKLNQFIKNINEEIESRTQEAEVKTLEDEKAKEAALEPLLLIKNQVSFAQTLRKAQNQTKLKKALELDKPEKLPAPLKQAFQILKRNETLEYDTSASIQTLQAKAAKSTLNEFIEELNELIKD